MFAYDSFGETQLTNSFASVLMTYEGEPRGGLLRPENVAGIQSSYFDREIALVGAPASYARSTADLQSPTTATGIYQNWDTNDWDFGTDAQYPAIKYNLAACQNDDLSQKRNALCGTVLPYQGSLMDHLMLVGNAGLNRPFDSLVFDYDISVGAEQQTMQFAAEAIAPDAAIVVYAGGDEVARVVDGMTPPIALNPAGDTVLDVVVEEGARTSYRYRFNVIAVERHHLSHRHRPRRRRLYRCGNPRTARCDAL